MKINVTPFHAGVVLGAGAALAQAYFKVIPPLAYGVCMVCHPRDLFNWTADHLFNLDWHYAMASTNWPLLTVVGVVAGALVAAAQHGELRLRPPRRSWFFFLNGFLMMNFGLLLGSCPIRIVILGAYGDWLGIVGWACVALGVVLASAAMRWSARRATDRSMAA